jgi:hypothetical protein
MLPAMNNGQKLRILIFIVFIIVIVVTANDVTEANQAMFTRITRDQPALQSAVEASGLDLRRRELPMLGRSTVHAFDVQVVVLVEGKFEGVQPVDFHHTAVFEDVEQGVSGSSHGIQSLEGKDAMIAHGFDDCSTQTVGAGLPAPTGTVTSDQIASRVGLPSTRR